MAEIVLKNIEKTYSGNIKAVNNFNLTIQDKEFVVLVGPSGCGKSTILRMIAGLEDITEGELYIGRKYVNDMPPKNRDIAMVFQNYALYPHMSVFQNMAFGLKMRRTPKKEIYKKVEETAEKLDILPLLKRKPKALSGGQRQRVALGRAMVREPAVFLLDEPLSNLDAKLRTQMRSEIIKIHKRLQATFVYVTHDQTEAMTMGDKIVVMKDGWIQQVDTPKNLYEKPCNLFVAEFIGSPQMNRLRGEFVEIKGLYYITVGDGVFTLSEENQAILKEKGYKGKSVWVGIRPEYLSIGIAERQNTIHTEIEFVEMTGAESYIHFSFFEQAMTAKISSAAEVYIGEEVYFRVDSSKLHIFDIETESALI